MLQCPCLAVQVPVELVLPVLLQCGGLYASEAAGLGGQPRYGLDRALVILVGPTCDGEVGLCEQHVDFGGHIDVMLLQLELGVHCGAQ